MLTGFRPSSSLPTIKAVVISEWGDSTKALTVWDLSTGKQIRRLTDQGTGTNPLYSRRTAGPRLRRHGRIDPLLGHGHRRAHRSS